ncbi:hypothetical protein [Streptosporangium fragile]|uniref:hypothetical protein n=1 Tax=Streptosporangium fragile TaxID=46186 RepID=UPI0031EB2B0F
MALPISLMAAPATAQDPTPSPATAGEPATVSDPAQVALAQAKKNNKRVEIEALRSETATYYANPDGKTLRAEVSTTPVRVQKDGIWQPVDPTLVEKDGVIQPKAVTGDITLSAGGNTDLVKVTGDRGPASVAAPATLPKPQLKGNTATYPDAYGPGTDLVITVTPSGFRQEIVIRQRPVKDLAFRIPVRLPKGLTFSTGKKPTLLDGRDKQIGELSAAPMVDATAANSPDTGKIGQAAVRVDGDTVVLSVPGGPGHHLPGHGRDGLGDLGRHRNRR